jgi:hypothetical protein
MPNTKACVRIQGGLGNARVSLQIDIGMESTIAEKFHAMVKLGVLNSRMKDFYDNWMLSRTFDFKGEMLAEAVEKTFENRNTPIPIKPTVFNPSFVNDQTKKIQWQGFIRKAKLSDAPVSFEDVVAAIKVSLNLSWLLLPRGGCSAASGALPDRGIDRRYLTSVRVNQKTVSLPIFLYWQTGVLFPLGQQYNLLLCKKSCRP